MALANALHKQYEGTSQGRGLKQSFELLGRKGLATIQTKGPFHHNLKEALYHIGEAHIREDWLEVSKAPTLKDLRSKSPEQLVELSKKIVEEQASSFGLDKEQTKPKNECDQELCNIIKWNRDILEYITLDQAIHSGDVGLMEAMLPLLLFRFIGSSNSKYAIKVIELLQGLHQEWPEDIK